MKPSEVLKAARQLITPPENWTQGAFSRDAEGGFPHLSVPFCFCSLGAGEHISGKRFIGERWSEYLVQVMRQSVASYNDNHSHEDVLAAFDKAIALAESEGN